MFLTQQGSTKRYITDVNDNVKVEFYDNEYVTRMGEFTDEAQNMKLVQKGAMQFIRDYKESILSEIDFEPKTIFKNIYEVGMHPSKIDLRKFGEMNFFDGEMLSLAAPKSIMSYCRSPKNMILDFYNSRWKIGFMKRLLKLPLPYKRIYEALKKIQK